MSPTTAEPVYDEFVDIGYDQETYEPPKFPVPPSAGRYQERLTAWEWNIRDGAVDGLRPITLHTKIVKGPYEGRPATYQRPRTLQYKTRQGSPLGDFLAAVAVALGRSSVRGADQIEKMLDEAAQRDDVVFTTRRDWGAFDSIEYKRLKAAGEAVDYKLIDVKGQSKFNPDGTITFASGNPGEAQSILVGFIPAKV